MSEVSGSFSISLGLVAKKDGSKVARLTVSLAGASAGNFAE